MICTKPNLIYDETRGVQFCVEFIPGVEEAKLRKVEIIDESLFVGHVQLPRRFAYKPITRIEPNVFYAKPWLKSIEIGEEVRSIGHKCFYNCENLTYVTFNGEMDLIGDSVFEKCESLKELTLPEGISFISPSLFRGCKSLRTIKLPHTVELIKTKAFNDCSSLETVECGARCASIDSGAFGNCHSLKTLKLNAHRLQYFDRAFSLCESLSRIEMHERANLQDIGSYLHGITKTVTIACGQKEYNIEFAKRYCYQMPVFFLVGTSVKMDLPNGVTVKGGIRLFGLVEGDPITEEKWFARIKTEMVFDYFASTYEEAVQLAIAHK